ncbi:hypothetical protein, partial [Candidatus Erwinia dacicola]
RLEWMNSNPRMQKAQKINQTTCDSLRPGYTFEDFLEAFKSLYPKDWEKLGNEYAKHERKTKPGKSHPMPEPVQYLKNALNVHQKK